MVLGSCVPSSGKNNMAWLLPATFDHSLDAETDADADADVYFLLISFRLSQLDQLFLAGACLLRPRTQMTRVVGHLSSLQV